MVQALLLMTESYLLLILKVLIILHLTEQITNASTGFATDKCNRFITFNMI